MTDTASFVTMSEDELLAYSHVQALAKIQEEIQALRIAIPALLSPLMRAPKTSNITPTSNPPSSSENGGPRKTSEAASTKSLIIAEPQHEFREQANKVQKDVKTLVKNLEDMCRTLEAAEKVKSEDYNERGELISQEPLQRTDVLKDLPADVAVSRAVHDPSNLAATTITTTSNTASNNDVGQTGMTGTSELTTGVVRPENGHSGSLEPPLANAEYLFTEDGLSSADNGLGDPNINLDVFDASLYNDFGLDAYADDWGAFGAEDMMANSN